MMKVTQISAKYYRSVRDQTIELDDLSVFIGANASGKSTILDALRFLSEAVRVRDFRQPTFARGGILNLAWKGAEANRVELAVVVEDEKRFEWTVALDRDGYDFSVTERVQETTRGDPPRQLLESNKGRGWWWSGEQMKGVDLSQRPMDCALSAASVDASFPARQVAEFVGGWGFFDPSPFLLRRDWNLPDAGGFDPYGRNLAETLASLPQDALDKVVGATKSIVGLPDRVETRASEERFFFVQEEPGLRFTVNQMGVSSGTLRMLALMTALYGHSGATLIGIEEPENYIHPSALEALVQHIQAAKERVQFVVSTHSPLLLSCLNEPEAVNIVKRDVDMGTIVQKESNPNDVRKALETSGFGLGEYHETRGFGS